jgi:hypothetical protein
MKPNEAINATKMMSSAAIDFSKMNPNDTINATVVEGEFQNQAQDWKWEKHCTVLEEKKVHTLYHLL